MTSAVEGPHVPLAARRVHEQWERLCTGTAQPDVFDVAMVADLPEPARRWLTHAIAPGTPLWQSAELTLHGEIRLGSWRPFTATQVVSPPRRYIWAATARVLGLPVVGYDLLEHEVGRMRWRLLDLLPVMTADGADVSRSAAGRLVGEIALAPTTFGTATWTMGDHPDRTTGAVRLGGELEAVELDVRPNGALHHVVVQRWGNPGGQPFGRYPFGVTVEQEQTFEGVTMPSAFRAAWWFGTERQDEGEFFRARVTQAVFR